MTSHTKTSSAHAPYREISPEKFLQMRDRADDPPLLLDVRSALEFRFFHAPDAQNLSLQRLLFGAIPGLKQWALPRWFRDLPRDRPVVVACLTAHRSPIAAKQLADAGFAEVYNLSGGMMAWRKAGLPCEGSSAAAPSRSPGSTASADRATE